ncbi:MAG: glycosyltransferase, partial [Thermodesulfovibrionales bacterium]|nr:glycosyltransferase [Thermodesulfovibrionales bacterium]
GARTSKILLNSGSKGLETRLRKLSPNSNIAQLLPPVDTGIFLSADRDVFRNKHKLGSCKLVTYVGGLKPFEGLSDLIKALCPLLEKNSEIVLVIAGGVVESDLSVLQNIVSTLSCKSQIIFPGQLNLPSVVNFLSASNILVLPKRDHPVNHHAMPIKLGEYFASGNPVVSAAIGGITDYLVHGMNGLLYSPGDINGLKREIEELLSNDRKAKNIGLAGQQTALQEFDINVVAQKLAIQLLRGKYNV